MMQRGPTAAGGTLPRLVLTLSVLALGAGTAGAQSKVGRLTIEQSDAIWELLPSATETSLPLEGSGLTDKLTSETRLLHLRGARGSDIVVMALRASTHSAPTKVDWTPACSSSRNLEARLLAPGTSAPDCIKVSGLVRPTEFAARALPHVADAAAAGRIVLPSTARYFSFLVTGPNGSFVSAAWLASPEVADIAAWAALFAAAAREAVYSLGGHLRIPPVGTAPCPDPTCSREPPSASDGLKNKPMEGR